MYKNKLIFFSFMMIFINILAISCCVKSSVRNNILYIESGANFWTHKVQSVMFTPIEYSITANQTFKRIKNGKDSIIIEAGRKSSEEVAQKFKLWTDGNIINNYNPKTLNFALTGVLTIKIHNTYLHTHRIAMFDHMVIAQGHIFLHNKWLLGGRNCIYSGKDPMSNQQYQLQCFDQQHRNWCFSLNSNNFNTFYIDRGKCN